jgi:Pyruvate/2-oxoacid:ferredoxin oxidoreductase delta subunit
MGKSENIHKLAERNQKGDSPAMHKILECAMTDEEAGFILELPASNADLAAKYGMDEKAVADKILDLARRGLLVSSRKGIRYPGSPATLHDNILASAREYIPAEIDKYWMELYEDEGWAEEIGNGMAVFPGPALRSIPILNSTPPDCKLLPHESIARIIQANKDLISARHCCCRTGAKKCDHPTEVCLQFGRRAEYDLYRSSGKKVSADEAMSISLEAGSSGLVPTVTNISNMQALEFICYCCGCCCMVLDPALRVGVVEKIVAPSRFLTKVDNDKCSGCEKCPKWCVFGAIEMQEMAGYEKPRAVIDPEKCLGCGVCVARCPDEGAMVLDLVKPPEFIPETLFGPSSILHS